MLIQMLMVL